MRHGEMPAKSNTHNAATNVVSLRPHALSLCFLLSCNWCCTSALRHPNRLHRLLVSCNQPLPYPVPLLLLSTIPGNEAFYVVLNLLQKDDAHPFFPRSFTTHHSSAILLLPHLSQQGAAEKLFPLSGSLHHDQIPVYL